MVQTLIIQLERLGDLIQTTPLLQDLHSARPDESVDVLVLDETRAVLDGLNGIANVRTLPGKLVVRLIQELRGTYPDMSVTPESNAVLSQLSLPHYDRVINLTQHEFGCWLAERVDAGQREGGVITEDGEWLSIGDWHLYLLARTDFRFENGFHVADLFRCIGPAETEPDSSRHPHVAQAASLPFDLPPGRRVALNPGSSKAARRWPTDYFSRMVDELRAGGIAPFLIGAPADRDVCAAVAAASAEPPPDFSGQTTVPEIALLLAQSELLISGDTGAVHIASAVGTKVVGVYGGTTVFRETAPWGEGHLIVQAPLSADGSTMRAVSPEVALAAADVLLGRRGRDSLREEARRAGVEVWETFFLPADADPLGGLSFRPIHDVCFTTSDLFIMVLRHVTAQRFLGQTDCVSTDHLRELLAAEHVSVSLDDERTVTKMLRDMDRLLRALAETAVEAEDLCYERDTNQMGRVEGLGQQVQQGVETLKTAAHRIPFIRPVVACLDWSLRNLRTRNAGVLFQRHEQELVRAADLLAETESLLQSVTTAL